MPDTGYRQLNMDIIKKKPSKVVSSSEALKNIVPVEWSDEVLSKKTRAVLDVPKGERVCAE